MVFPSLPESETSPASFAAGALLPPPWSMFPWLKAWFLLRFLALAMLLARLLAASTGAVGLPFKPALPASEMQKRVVNAVMKIRVQETLFIQLQEVSSAPEPISVRDRQKPEVDNFLRIIDFCRSLDGPASVPTS